jgi:FkbM family methyltransferase
MKFHRLLRLFVRMTPFPVCESLLVLMESKLGIGSGAFFGDSGESIAQECACAISKNAFIGFDVGSNTGQYLLPLHARVSRFPKWQIHCFEPSSTAFARLSGSAPRDPRIFLNHCALGAKIDRLTLYSNFEGSQLASLSPRDLAHHGIDHRSCSEQVDVTALDHYCTSHGITEITLLKIDVEGREMDVLQGAEQMIGNSGIHCLQFEFGGCNIDTRVFVRDFFQRIRSAEMSLFRIIPGNKLYPIKKYSENLERFNTTNFFAIQDRFLLDVPLLRKYIV